MTQKQKSTTTSEPWKPAQAGLKNTLETADNWQTSYQDRPLYQGSSVAGFDPSQTAALEGIEQRAASGSPLVGQSQDYISKVLSGDFIKEGNPYLEGVRDSITRSVMPGVNATFSMAGRTGDPGGAHAYSLSKALSDSFSPYAFQNYENERGRMDQAAQFAPQLAHEDYYDLDRQFQAGAVRQGQAQNQLTDDISRYYQEQYRPFTAAQEASSLTNPIAGMGGTSTTTQETKANPLTSILGGAMMAYGAMNPAAGAMMGAAGGASGITSALGGAGRTIAPSTYVPPPAYTPMYYGSY